MNSKPDNPGIYIPPPIYIITVFLLALILQHVIPIKATFLLPIISKIIGWVLILVSALLGFTALYQFYRSGTTHLTFKPVTALQTTGLYSLTRNPMYLGLFLFYTGVSLLIGSWWHLALLPVLFLVFQEYIIKREEQYLERRFGQQYLDYKNKVRRWL